MPRTFLTARWLDLVLANYPVPDGLLIPLLPRGLELDRFEGSAFVSLVAFRFIQTRIAGVKWPFHTDFNEVNLRFYVREPDGTRGVAFVREYVPQLATVLIARTAYNEPYARARIDARVTETESERSVWYALHKRRRHTIEVVASPDASTPPEDSAAHFFKEHSFGYGTGHAGHTLRYEVRHPVWQAHDVRTARIDVDWAELYGKAWGVLQEKEPATVFLAAGSDVSVMSPVRLDPSRPSGASKS